MELRSADRRFGLRLCAQEEAELRERCARSWPHETGGILIGYYTAVLDMAVVTRLPPTPPDSISGRTRFVRGLRGLGELLLQLWHRPPGQREYYLGEWHYHPGQCPVPSFQDHAQMKAIAGDPRYQCPEPVLLVVGGNPAAGWSIAVHVYPRGREPGPLLQVADEG